MTTIDFQTANIHEVKSYLADNLHKLGESDLDFASSLLRPHFPSVKQEHWIRVLAGRTVPKAAAPKVDGLSSINELFNSASRKAKYPKIIIRSEDGDLRLSVAGPTSKEPGTINVTTNGSFEDRTWFGRINHQGEFVASGKATGKPAIASALKAFAADPVSVASNFGRETGCCCFCSRELTDSRSIEVGYGPICADKFALPWG